MAKTQLETESNIVKRKKQNILQCLRNQNTYSSWFEKTTHQVEYISATK